MHDARVRKNLPEQEESPIVNLDPKAIIGLALDPKGLIGGAAKLAERAGDEAYFAALCIRSGLVGVEPPHHVAQLLVGFQRYGLLGGAVVAGGVRPRSHARRLPPRRGTTVVHRARQCAGGE